MRNKHALSFVIPKEESETLHERCKDHQCMNAMRTCHTAVLILTHSPGLEDENERSSVTVVGMSAAARRRLWAVATRKEVYRVLISRSPLCELHAVNSINSINSITSVCCCCCYCCGSSRPAAHQESREDLHRLGH